MSVGSRTAGAILGSIALLAGLAFAIRHKAEISQWADSVFGAVTQQTSAAAAPSPAAPAAPQATPTPATPAPQATPRGPPSPLPRATPSPPSSVVAPPVTSTFQPTPPAATPSQQEQLDTILGTVVPPDIPQASTRPPPTQQRPPPPAQQQAPTFPTIPQQIPGRGPTQTMPQQHVTGPLVIPSRPPTPPARPPPSQQEQLDTILGTVMPPTIPPSTRVARPKPGTVPQPPPAATRPPTRTPNQKLQRGGICLANPAGMECGTKCRTNGIDYYVTCMPGAAKAYIRAGVEGRRGWWGGDWLW